MVTNLETGRTAIVTIRDRGPYVKVPDTDAENTISTYRAISR
jgi:hypothetical protein